MEQPNEPQHDQTRSVRKSVGVLRFSENSVDQTKEGDHEKVKPAFEGAEHLRIQQYVTSPTRAETLWVPLRGAWDK